MAVGTPSWLFEDQQDQAYERLMEMSREFNYGPGDMIFQEGQPAFGVYIISSGKVKLSKYGSNGKKQILKLLSAGEILGEKTMFDNEIYTAHAKTLEDTTLHFIERNAFIEYLKDHPEVSLRLIEKLCREIKGFQGKLVEIAYENSSERLARLLLLLAKEYGIETEDGLDIGIELSRADFAELAGMTTETAIRTLSKFKERGMIALDGSKIYITDKDQLNKLAEPFLVGLKENLL